MFLRDLLQPWHVLVLLVLAAFVALIVIVATRTSRPSPPPSYLPPPYTPSPPPQPGEDPAATLAKAKTMLDQGLISQSEYDQVKQNVLAKMQR
jgi:hypothetical protein